MQEFFKTTLISKFIKYILMVTPLPNVSFLNDYDMMVENNLYIYHGKIYRCTRTGIFNGSHIVTKDYLYCSESVYCGSNLKCTDKLTAYGGKRLAQYEVVDTYFEGKDIPGITEYFHSTRTYYDEETHIKLGDYLRLLKSMYGLDLMSLYNCYCNYYVYNVDISKGKLYDSNNLQYKTTLVPIKFNKTYTIALDCSSTFFMKPVIYDGKLIKTLDKKNFVYDNTYTNIIKTSGTSSRLPIKIDVSNVDPYAQSLERYLYLAIQLPIDNKSSIVVLEGSYNNYYNKVQYDSRMFENSTEGEINKTFLSRPSLLNLYKNSKFNTNLTIPFSDRLIEYLVGHTIDVREDLSENILMLTKKLGYTYGYEGSWSQQLRSKIFESYMSLQKTKQDVLDFDDILGYVDKDVEEALHRRYMNNGDTKNI